MVEDVSLQKLKADKNNARIKKNSVTLQSIYRVIVISGACIVSRLDNP